MQTCKRNHFMVVMVIALATYRLPAISLANQQQKLRWVRSTRMPAQNSFDQAFYEFPHNKSFTFITCRIYEPSVQYRGLSRMNFTAIYWMALLCADFRQAQMPYLAKWVKAQLNSCIICINTCNYELLCFRKLRMSTLYLHRDGSSATEPPSCATTVAQKWQNSRLRRLRAMLLQVAVWIWKTKKRKGRRAKRYKRSKCWCWPTSRRTKFWNMKDRTSY